MTAVSAAAGVPTATDRGRVGGRHPVSSGSVAGFRQLRQDEKRPASRVVPSVGGSLLREVGEVSHLTACLGAALPSTEVASVAHPGGPPEQVHGGASNYRPSYSPTGCRSSHSPRYSCSSPTVRIGRIEAWTT